MTDQPPQGSAPPNGANGPPPGTQQPGGAPPAGRPWHAPDGAQPPPSAFAQPGTAPPPAYPPPAGPPVLNPSAPITSDDKLWGALAHAAIFVFPIFGALIVMMIYKDKSHYITFHSKQALIFQVIASVVGGLSCGVLYLVCMVFAVIAAIKAYEGQHYTYPGLGNINV